MWFKGVQETDEEKGKGKEKNKWKAKENEVWADPVGEFKSWDRNKWTFSERQVK